MLIKRGGCALGRVILPSPNLTSDAPADVVPVHNPSVATTQMVKETLPEKVGPLPAKTATCCGHVTLHQRISKDIKGTVFWIIVYLLAGW